MQGAKQQLDQALGVVTGQAPVVPGADMTAGADLGGELPPVSGDEEIDAVDVDLDDIEEPKNDVSLGRERRK